MMKQNSFSLSVRVNANVVFILLVVRNERLDNEIVQFSTRSANLS